MSISQHVNTMAANTGQTHGLMRNRSIGSAPKKTENTTTTKSGEPTAGAETSKHAAIQNAVEGVTPKRRRRYGRHIRSGDVGQTRGRGVSKRGEARPSRRVGRSRMERQRMLTAAFSDTSRQIQGEFLSKHGHIEGPSSHTGRLNFMVSRLITIVNNQLGQYTGDEPYKRADYRLFLNAFDGLRGSKSEPQDPWANASSGLALSQSMSQAGSIMDFLNLKELPGTKLEEFA